jgi:hypothetical protein
MPVLVPALASLEPQLQQRLPVYRTTLTVSATVSSTTTVTATTLTTSVASSSTVSVTAEEAPTVSTSTTATIDAIKTGSIVTTCELVQGPLTTIPLVMEVMIFSIAPNLGLLGRTIV